jgi:hypothetical protein
MSPTGESQPTTGWPAKLAEDFPYPEAVHREADHGGVVKRATDRNEFDTQADGLGGFASEAEPHMEPEPHAP